MKRVLIVDDSEPIRERVAALLEQSRRIRIVGQAGSRQEALRAIESREPDTVILDIHLPGGSGIQVLREVKDRYPGIRIIMLTNFDNAMYRRQCRQFGADEFLNKTLEFDRIVDTVTADRAPNQPAAGPHGKEFLMKTFKHILVVSRSTRHCLKVLQTGISLARQYGASLHIIHILHDPFSLDGWNLPTPAFEDEYLKMLADAKKELDAMVAAEKTDGLTITEEVKTGTPEKEIENAVKEKHIDLILMLAHREGRIEHFLFGKTNDAIIRSLPATLMLVK